MIKINIILDYVERMLTVAGSVDQLIAVDADAVLKNDLKCLEVEQLIINNQDSIKLLRGILSLIQNCLYFENGNDFLLVQHSIKLGNIVNISSIHWSFRHPPEHEVVLVHVYNFADAAYFKWGGLVFGVFWAV